VAGAINLTEVDFDQIKTNLIDYLKSTGKFTDYDFDGSNLQVILNLIAYQAQLNAYSTNMIANESFLTSATLRSNVVANARMIGYLPTSARAAFSEVDFRYQLDEANYPSGMPKTLEIQPGMAFSSENGTENLIFNVIDPVTSAVSSDGLCTFTDVVVYEGVYLKANFTKDTSVYDQKFTIANQNIDTNTIRVEVQENPNQDVNTQYFYAKNLAEIDENSRVYWIEETSEGHYELTFGDGLFGKALANGAKVFVTYLVTNGDLGNGVSGTNNYGFVGKVYTNTGVRVSDEPTVTGAERSSGGAPIEDVSSIKFRAPRDYASQNRCVIAEDYETIVRRIYPSADDIYVFGGELLSTPQYGRVYIVIKPFGSDGLTNQAKTYIRKSLDKYRVGSLDIVIVDADLLYVEVISTIYYDDTKTLKDSSSVTAAVKTTLNEYGSSSTVSKFGGAIRYSRVVSSIDDADLSITRNNTSLRMRRDMVAVLNTAAAYELCFENSFANIRNSGKATVYSTGFRLLDDTKTYYFEDDTKGGIYRFYLDSSNKKVIVDETFGTVDYTKGEIKIAFATPITIVNTNVGGDIVEVRAIPLKQDIIAKQTIYVDLDVAKSDIVSIVDTEITGS
jgi:hypothetical protein